MQKKVIPILLLMCLTFSISVMAENTVVEETASEVTEQIQQNTQNLPQDSGNTGKMPNDNMQGRTPPNMPNGQMPSRENMQGRMPPNMPNGQMPSRGNMQGRIPPDMSNREMPSEGMDRGQGQQDNFVPPQGEGEFTPPRGRFSPSENGDENNNTVQDTPEAGNESTESTQSPRGNQWFGGQMPGGMGGFQGNRQNFGNQPVEDTPKGFWGFVKTYSTPITSVVLLGLAFIFVIFYRRKNY